MSLLRLRRLLCAALGTGLMALAFTGCAAHRHAAARHAPDHGRMPRYLVIGRAGSTNIVLDHRVVIGDEAFVRELFTAVAKRSTNQFSHTYLIPMRPLVFLDDHWDICAGFLYFPFGRREAIFRPCSVERLGSEYVFTKRGVGDAAVPGFEDKCRPFLDIGNLDLP